MPTHRARMVALFAVIVCTACDDATTSDDAAAPSDGGGVVDAAPVDGGGEPVDGGSLDAFVPGTDGGGSGCDGMRPTVSGITRTEGLVIARDGTIYYSQSGGVGRLTVGGTPDDDWVRLEDAGTVWGLALDAANETLYVGSATNGTIDAIDLTVTPAVGAVFATSAGQPNGLTMGPDGALYFSDFGGDRVRRVELGGATGTVTDVTTTDIASANGVAFLPDGTLLVASYTGGTLVRLTLTDGVETARAPFASGLGSPDGVAVDADGRVYVTDNGGGRLLRLEADGTGVMMLRGAIGAAASLDFGSGALDCEDLYIASSGPMQRYEAGTAAGADVPWH